MGCRDQDSRYLGTLVHGIVQSRPTDEVPRHQEPVKLGPQDAFMVRLSCLRHSRYVRLGYPRMIGNQV
jgi:hypothetical protein